MARCEDCIHYKVCDDWAKSVNDEYCACVELHPCENFINTADVVPKSEVEKIFAEIERLCDAHLYWNNCSIIQRDDIAELKKKYTEEKV